MRLVPDRRAIECLTAFLEGEWTLCRRLTDLRRGLEGSFVGEARFVATGAPDCFDYLEEGTLTWPGYEGRATRALSCNAGDASSVAFYFLDGRPFYELALSTTAHRATHLCGDDRYEGTFVLEDASSWRASWSVKGPSKSVLIEGRYQRRAH